MNSTILTFLAISVFALGFRFYSGFLAKKVAKLEDSRPTPAVKFNDHVDYVPTKKWPLLFYHYATIAGAGVIVGPTLSAQYGWLPCLLWIMAATCLAGGVHDFMVMFLSVRHEGKSIGEIARSEVGRVSWTVVTTGVYFMVVIAIAGMGMGLMSALEHNPSSILVVLCTIPTAIFLYLCERCFKLRIIISSVLGSALLVFIVIVTPVLRDVGLLSILDLSRGQLIFLLAFYASVASILPIDRILAPRNRLSGYMKVLIVGFLTLILLFTMKVVKMPSIMNYAFVGGPVVSGSLWPFLFIIITCGAISGWHSLCCSGVTPRCISRESDIRIVAYGGWLLESMIAVAALILACTLYPQDYFAINCTPTVYASLGMQPFELPKLSNALGFNLQGKTGGIVSFSISAAKTFAEFFGEKYLKQLYLFMVVYMAIFIMPIMDHGTRMARYFVQDALGITTANPRKWRISTIIITCTMASLWSYMLQTGTISLIWQTFGICNQLMASIGLTVATSYIIKKQRPIYGLVTYWPILIFASASIHGAVIKITTELLPLETTVAYIQTAILLLFIVLFTVTFVDASIAYIKTIRGKIQT